MRHQLLISGIVASLLVVAGGCARKQAVVELEERTQAMQTRLAAADARVAALEAENRDLNARIDALDQWKEAARVDLRQLTDAAYLSRDDAERIIGNAVRQAVTNRVANGDVDARARREDETREERRERWERRGREWEQQRVERMQEDLGLSDQQIEQTREVVKNARTSVREAFREMRETGNMDRDQIREALAGIKTDSDAAMKEILDAEQFEKMQAAGSPWTRGGRWGDRRRNRDGDDPAE